MLSLRQAEEHRPTSPTGGGEQHAGVTSVQAAFPLYGLARRNAPPHSSLRPPERVESDCWRAEEEQRYPPTRTKESCLANGATDHETGE
jgi:hypothetical protein